MATVRCYNFAAVYNGNKEFQLEQIRAMLPQYRADLLQPTATQEPVVCYQKGMVYPPGGGELQLEQVRAMLPQYQPVCDMEMTQVVTTINPLNSVETLQR